MSQQGDLRLYEEVLVLHPDTNEKDQKQIYAENLKVIESYKGTLHHLDTWGSRPIVNRGKKVTRGWYFHAVFSAEPEAISELRRKFRINDRIIYFHHEKLSRGTLPKKHIEDFHQLLVQSARREQERQLKIQKKVGVNGTYSSKRY